VMERLGAAIVINRHAVMKQIIKSNK
jgi:hypothetical protein